MRRVFTLGVCIALVCGLGALWAGAAAAEETPYEREYQQALALGIRGYMYAQPLLDTERIFKTSTSVTVPTALGYAPVNQFSHFQTLATTKESVVVAPNNDTLYAIAWLNLKSQPVVLHVPEAERFDVVELISPWTENFANVGTEASGIYAPGNYLIAAPGTDEGLEEVEGLKVIHSPYDRVWLVGRVVVDDAEDTPNALAIEEQMKLVPLKQWKQSGLAYKPPPPKTEVTTPTVATIPGTGEGENPLKYWRALSRALKEFPPPAADAQILEELATVNIGPGKFPSSKDDSAATVAALKAAVQYGPDEVLKEIFAAYERGFEAHNGWLVASWLVAGRFGTNYTARADADRLGVGLLRSNVSIYPTALFDHEHEKLNGSMTRYVAHFPASDLPIPVKAFWSMTMYEASGFLVSNPLNRYSLGNRSTLHFNPDGSLDFYIQTAEPTSEEQRENWLPAPAGEFHLVMRLYATDPEDIGPITEGTPGSWQPPTIEACQEDGFTAGGVECAD